MTNTSDFLSWEFDPHAPAPEDEGAEPARKVPSASLSAFDAEAEQLHAALIAEAAAKAHRKELETAILRRFPDAAGEYVATSGAFSVRVVRHIRRKWDQEALAALSSTTSPEWIEPSFKANTDKIPAADLKATLDAYSTVERGKTSVTVQKLS